MKKGDAGEIRAQPHKREKEGSNLPAIWFSWWRPAESMNASAEKNEREKERKRERKEGRKKGDSKTVKKAPGLAGRRLGAETFRSYIHCPARATTTAHKSKYRRDCDSTTLLRDIGFSFRLRLLLLLLGYSILSEWQILTRSCVTQCWLSLSTSPLLYYTTTSIARIVEGSVSKEPLSSVSLLSGPTIYL